MRPLTYTRSITDATASTVATVYARRDSSVVEQPLDKGQVASSFLAPGTKGTCAVALTTAASLSCGGSTMVVRRSAKSKAAGSSPVPRSTSRGRAPTVIAVGEGLSAGVAQLVELQFSKLIVAGSSPATRSQRLPDTLQVGTKSDVAGSSPVCAVSPEWEGSGLQPRRPHRQRRFDSATVLHPLNMTAVPSARRLVCSRGCSSMAERQTVSLMVGGSIPSVLAPIRSETVMNSNARTDRENWRTSSDRSPYKGRSGDGTGLQNQSAGFDFPAPCQQQQ